LTPAILVALIASFALGANAIGMILLLMMNPRSRSLRGYAAFITVVNLWLLAQAAISVTNDRGWFALYMTAVALMPGFFLAFAFFDSERQPTWRGLAIIALTGALVPLNATTIVMAHPPAWRNTIMWSTMIVGWIGGSFMMWVVNRRQRLAQRQAFANIRQRLLVILLTIFGPVSVVGAMMLDSRGFIAYVMPLLTVLIQIMIFYGVTRMQFYDIDVRIGRSGEMAAQAAETARLAVLGELAATIAHEVRNPLTGVRSLAQQLAEDDVPTDKRRAYGKVILEETSRVERLVDNLLDVARRSRRTTAFEPTVVAALFDDLKLLINARAERAGVSITVNVPADCTANAPREALAQALLNLLLNAIAHSPAGSRVELSAQQLASATEIKVRDHGAGIPAAERNRIFEPFYTTTAQGTGLGLSVVRHLAREYDWQIEVRDADGGGTEFILTVH
jgi:signal transduction histidine kinase